MASRLFRGGARLCGHTVVCSRSRLMLTAQRVHPLRLARHKSSLSKSDESDASTRAIHADAGMGAAAFAGSVSPPISMTTTYSSDAHADGFVYARDDQPVRARCERVLGLLDGGDSVLYGSGLAAVFACLYRLMPRRVAIRGGYHGTHNVLNLFKSRHGVETTDIDGQVGPGDVVWLESPRNPMCEIYDIKAHAERAAEVGAVVVVDGTLAPPPLQRPLDLGAFAVVHSATKYLSGHSDCMVGAITTSDVDFSAGLREDRSSLGSVPGGLETWLLLRSLRTLHVRVKRQSDSATRVAGALAGALADGTAAQRFPSLTKVYHPSLSPPAFAEAQMPEGYGGVLSIELDSEERARALPSRLAYFQDATSLGGVESLVEWRHKYDSEVPPGLLRLSIGLEEPKDLLQDIESALRGLQG